MSVYCKECQSEIIAPICVSFEDIDSEYSHLEEFILDTEKQIAEIKDLSGLDLKTLKVGNRNIVEVFQMLVDEILQLKTGNQTNTTTSQEDCNLDWRPLNICNDCDNSYCDNMQLLIDTVSDLKSKIDE